LFPRLGSITTRTLLALIQVPGRGQSALRPLLAGLAVMGLVLATPGTALQQGSTRYVNGADPTCGGHAPCFSTIQAAVVAAAAGDRIVIQPGTYVEQVNITSKNSGTGATEADRIVVEADPAAPSGSVVLDGSVGQCTNGHAVRFQQSRFVTLRGLTITGAGGQAVALMGGNNGNQAIHLERLRIFGNGSSECNGGITVNRDNPGTLVANSLIYGNGRNGVAFLDADGGPHYLIGNTIHGNAWSGVSVARNHETWLINNAITGNGTASGSTGGRFGVVRESSTNPQPGGIRLLNNLICDNRLGEISGPALDATDAGNLTPTGAEGIGVTANPGCAVPSALYEHMAGDDNLVSTADDDFKPATSSPLVDVGMDPRTLSLGLNGVLLADFLEDGVRPHNATGTPTARFDIGAIELRSANQPPLANAGTDRTVVEGVVVGLDGAASSDPDGDVLIFEWTQTSGPAVPLTGADTATATFTAPPVSVPMALVFRLTVRDGQAVVDDTVAITVVPANRPPALDPIGNRTVAIGATLTFTLTGSDPDGDPLTFSAGLLPANAAFDAGTRTFTFTPAPDQVGTAAATFSVSDGRGGTASETISIAVTSGLQVTITEPAPGATVAEGFVMVRGTVVGAGGEVGVLVNGVSAIVQGQTYASLVQVTPEANAVTAVATAATGATASHTVSLSVGAVNPDAPQLRVTPVTGVAPLTVEFSVLGGPSPATYELDANGDGVTDLTAAALAGQTFTYTVPGAYLARVRIQDSAGNAFTSTAPVWVVDAAALDALLRAKWSAVKNALRAGAIEDALTHIAIGKRPVYRAVFMALGSQLAAIDQILTDISAVRHAGLWSDYHMLRLEDGVELSYFVLFVLDEDGIWRLKFL
jgi:hypothetical protein